MVAHFPQLHEHIHDGEEVRVSQRIFRLIIVDVLVIEQALASTQVALHDMLHFLGKLLFDITFHAAKQEGSQDGLKFLHDADVERLILVDTLAEWI